MTKPTMKRLDTEKRVVRAAMNWAKSMTTAFELSKMHAPEYLCRPDKMAEHWLFKACALHARAKRRRR